MKNELNLLDKMKNMNQTVVDAILSLYLNKVQFLKSFELIDTKGFARFDINSDFYCISNEPVYYFTAAELQICLNQFLYIYLTHMNLINIMIDDFSVEDLNNNNLIVEQTVHFKNPIDCSKSIQGQIEILSLRKFGKTSYITCGFDFNKACFGSVKIILKTA